MKHQHHTHKPNQPNVRRVRSRWWVAGLAGMTGLALTAVGVAVSPAADAGARTLTTTTDDDRGKREDKDKEQGDSGRSADREKKRKGTPVPCGADALIAAITLANARGGAVLDLAAQCTYTLTADLDGAGLPAVTAPVTLNGNKNTTITRAAAADQFRILTVDTGGDLTVNHLKVTGGHTADDGGGILVNTGATLTINHSAITRNIASNRGGGIANNGTTRVLHSTVSRNTANSIGAGITSIGVLEVRKSHVNANSAAVGVAGIFSIGTVRIEHSTIAANHGQIGNIGGLFVRGTGTVTNSRVVNNTAGEVGGILADFDSQLILRSVTLTGNRARTGRGGGLAMNPNAAVVVEKSVVTNNTAAAEGGGVYSFAELVTRHTKITGNQASRGGGVFNTTIGTADLFSTKVRQNVAVTDGGGIANDGGTVHLNAATGTIVIKNRPNNCVSVPGCGG